METNFYPNIVGCRDTTQKLSFYCKSFEKTQIFPNILLVASRGQGKSHIARETGRNLAHLSTPKNISKPFIEINSSSIKNVETLINYVFMPHVFGDKSATIFLDECHSLKSAVVDMLLTILNPNKENKNLINYQGKQFVISFERITFILATTEIQKVFPALRNRLSEIHIEEYNHKDLAEIIRRNLKPELKVNDEILLSLASLSRETPRTAIMLADNVKKYININKTKEFKRKDLEKLTTILGIFPFGLSRLEVQILQLVSKEPAISLTKLVACTGMTKSAMQNLEYLLLKLNLIYIEGKRKITHDGLSYLELVKNRLENV